MHRTAIPWILAIVLLLPGITTATPVLDDDAGSGRDAGETPAGAVPVEPHRWYVGAAGTNDRYDHYAFESKAGAPVAVALAGDAGVCVVTVLDGTGQALPTSCALRDDGAFEFVATTPTSGTSFIRVQVTLARAYRFSFEEGRSPSLLTEVEDDDAGSGRDAGPTRKTAVRILAGVAYEGFALGPFLDMADGYLFDAQAGQVATIFVDGSVGCYKLFAPNETEIDTACSYSRAFNTGPIVAKLPVAGSYFVEVTALTPASYAFGVGLNEASPVGSTVAPPEIPPLELPEGSPVTAGADPTCGTGVPVTATSGEGPQGLVFAALKTGGRAVVAWTTAESAALSLTFNVSGGAEYAVSEATARTTHVFVLDRLPEGETLCFTPDGLPPATMKLANAMRAHDGEAYTLNLLVLADEQPDMPAVRRALDDFAWRLADATDGAVRAGKVVTLYGDLDHHDSGWASCYMPNTVIATHGASPTCRGLVDVVFTLDAHPAGAASTYRDGITRPDAAIWMNSYWQAGLVNLGDDVGAVLMHEVGHYAFGALDLYGSADCDVVDLGISVMGSSRTATEFDDEINRCPNEAEIDGYVPTWTLLRERFPLVPDRAGAIDPGPVTAGGGYARHDLVLAPQAGAEGGVGTGPPEGTPDVRLDDAGSGRDAGDTPDAALPIEASTRYVAGGGTRDTLDHYVFDGTAGDVVAVALQGTVLCVLDVLDASGEPLPTRCSLGDDGSATFIATLVSDGPAFLRIDPFSTPVYAFAFERDGLPPSLTEGGPDVRVADAGTGRDAGDTPETAVPIVPSTRYVGGGGTADPYDHFVFQGLAGEVVAVALHGTGLCVLEILDASGSPLPTQCVLGDDGATNFIATLPSDGPAFLRIDPSFAPIYVFAFERDGSAPSLL